MNHVSSERVHCAKANFRLPKNIVNIWQQNIKIQMLKPNSSVPIVARHLSSIQIWNDIIGYTLEKHLSNAKSVEKVSSKKLPSNIIWMRIIKTTLTPPSVDFVENNLTNPVHSEGTSVPSMNVSLKPRRSTRTDHPDGPCNTDNFHRILMSHGLIESLHDLLKEMSNDRFGLESDKESESIFSLFNPPRASTD